MPEDIESNKLVHSDFDNGLAINQGSGSDGVITGSLTTADGVIGDCLQRTANVQKVAFGIHNLTETDDQTYCWWAKHDGGVDTIPEHAGCYGGLFSNAFWRPGIGTPDIFFRVYLGEVNKINTQILTDGLLWRFFAVTFNGSHPTTRVIRTYSAELGDSVVTAYGTVTNPTGTWNSGTKFTAFEKDNNTAAGNCLQDETRFYDRELTVAQINAVLNFTYPSGTHPEKRVPARNTVRNTVRNTTRDAA